MLIKIESPSRLDLEIKRILIACLDDAILQLQEDSTSIHKRIHDVRKRFKECRAILELLGPKYQSQQKWYKKRARSLAELRDAKAMLESCDKLARYFTSKLSFDPFSTLKQQLENRLQQVLASHPLLTDELRQLSKELVQAKDEVHNWQIKDSGFELLKTGLQKSYRAGRQAYGECQLETANQEYHVWRKQVKAHWYHTTLLNDSWTFELTGRARALKCLANLLGDDHDLFVLEQLLVEEAQHLAKPKQIKELFSLVSQRRLELQKHSLSLGSRLYAEKPSTHIARLEHYWKSWQLEVEQNR